MKRVFLIVLDSFGIGEMPDAAAYGDINVNTLRSVSRSPYFHMEHMKNMGLFNIDGVEVGEKTDHPTAAYTRMTELARKYDIKVICSNDVHFVDEENAEAHEDRKSVV